jgi:DNA replication and repair protein RecF
MFTKPPESRRKYLNMVLSQKNLGYLDALGKYKKVLFQKTRLLQDVKAQRSQGEDLAEWNEQLIALGGSIILERKKLISFLNTRIAEIYTAISGFHRPVEVSYDTLPGESLDEIFQSFRQKLGEVSKKEAVLAACLVGPHRDDFSLKSDGLFLSPFSSRGELRSQVLALKILEMEFLSNGDEKPVLLLDDVLSELDETRRTFLLKYLQGKFQAFITTTHPLEMPAQHITLTPAVEEEVKAN